MYFVLHLYLRENGFVLSEPFLKVYDTRNLRTFIPVPVKFPIVLSRFANSIYNGRILLASRVFFVLNISMKSKCKNIIVFSMVK